MRRQFNSGYDEAITLIKQLKNSNDYLNRAIGVQSPNTVALKVKRQHSVIEQTLQKIEALIQRLEQSYLDPDTARKIGTIKQQFRIQRDRRKQLLHSVEAEERDSYFDRGSKESQLTTFSSMGVENPRKNGGDTRNRYEQREQQPVRRKNKQNVGQQHQYDQMGVNFELQHKIMRQRNAQLDHVSKSLMNVHSIMQETSNLTFDQGEKIDIIGQDLFHTYRNAKQARQNLSQANEHQKRARRKYIYLSLLILLGLAITLIVLLV